MNRSIVVVFALLAGCGPDSFSGSWSGVIETNKSCITQTSQSYVTLDVDAFDSYIIVRPKSGPMMCNFFEADVTGTTATPRSKVCRGKNELGQDLVETMLSESGMSLVSGNIMKLTIPTVRYAEGGFSCDFLFVGELRLQK